MPGTAKVRRTAIAAALHETCGVDGDAVETADEEHAAHGHDRTAELEGGHRERKAEAGDRRGQPEPLSAIDESGSDASDNRELNATAWASATAARTPGTPRPR